MKNVYSSIISTLTMTIDTILLKKKNYNCIINYNLNPR